MEAVIVEDLFKGNQLEELRHWLDNETPYWEDQTWERSHNGVMKKTCAELNTYHIATIDKARDIFAVHNLLPTFSTLNWYEQDTNHAIHKDTDPIEYTIMYNYYSDESWNININGQNYKLENETAIAYYGSQQDHGRLENPGGVTVALYFNYAKPDNYHFALGEHSSGEVMFPSRRHEFEVEKDWL